MNSNPRHNTVADKDYRTSDFQRLCWTIFIHERRYNYHDLAGFLNKKADTVLAYFEGELRLHLDTARQIIRFVAERNPNDTDLLDLFLKPAGRISVREDMVGKSLKESYQDDLLDLHDIFAQLSYKVRQSYRAAKITMPEERGIRKKIQEMKEALTELGYRVETDVENGVVPGEAVRFLRRRA